MCGICGFIQPEGFIADRAQNHLRAMADCLRHRGPDSEGYWLDERGCVALGHRRLAVIELSPAGHQPMASASGRYHLILNGEIYNHEDLRKEVGRFSWRGRSDTESLLAAFDAFGIQTALERSVGMFALAVWDAREQRLTLARDRLGEKPLYYGWQNGVLLFGSELKSIATHPAFKGKVDLDALAGYLQGGYVRGNDSIFQGVKKLPPGSLWSWQADDRQGSMADPVPYWSLSQVISSGGVNAFEGTPSRAIDRLDELLRQAVSGQMSADVPVGAFLSGGIDSSTVVAVMQSLHGDKVKTFTIGSTDKELDEADAARQIASHLGTDHTELTVSAKDALSIATRLGTIYDEPFGDSSAIPTFLVCGLAAQQVTVALSGDGGDELFAGYPRYHEASRVWSLVGNRPRFAKSAAATIIDALPLDAIDRQLVRTGVIRQPDRFSGRARSLARALIAETSDDLYRLRLENWPDPATILTKAVNQRQGWAESQPTSRSDEIERMMAADMRSYLPDDILVKVDRAASAHSLETRVPLLDHRIVEFSWTLPLPLKTNRAVSKWLLRELLYRYVPRELVDRPKKGFAVPVAEWLRGPLREWAEDLLSTQALEGEGPFRAEPVRKLWENHLAGSDWQYVLWPILSYQQWARSNRHSLP